MSSPLIPAASPRIIPFPTPADAAVTGTVTVETAGFRHVADAAMAATAALADGTRDSLPHDCDAAPIFDELCTLHGFAVWPPDEVSHELFMLAAQQGAWLGDLDAKVEQMRGEQAKATARWSRTHGVRWSDA